MIVADIIDQLDYDQEYIIRPDLSIVDVVRKRSTWGPVLGARTEPGSGLLTHVSLVSGLRLNAFDVRKLKRLRQMIADGSTLDDFTDSGTREQYRSIALQIAVVAAQKVAALQSETKEAIAERDAAIRNAFAVGVTKYGIANLSGLNEGLVGRIVNRGIKNE